MKEGLSNHKSCSVMAYADLENNDRDIDEHEIRGRLITVYETLNVLQRQFHLMVLWFII